MERTLSFRDATVTVHRPPVHRSNGATASPVPPVYYYEESSLLFPRVQRGSYEKKLRIGGHVLSQYVPTHFSFLGVIFFSEYKMYLYLHISAVEGQVSRNDERYLFLVDRFWCIYESLFSSLKLSIVY